MDLFEIVDKGSRLLGIYGRRDSDNQGSFKAIVLEFENSEKIYLDVDVDTDELVLGFSDGFREPNWDISRGELIVEGGEYVLLWFWEMKNQKEYFDAFQLEFFEKGSSISLILQFKVEAAGIYVFSVNEQRKRRQP